MKILFDPQIFHIQKFGGISTIFSELWLRMNSEPNIEIQCPIIYSENIYLKNMGLWKSNFSSLLNLNFKGSGRIKDYLFHLSRKRTISYLEKGNFDIFIPTYYNPYFLEHLHGKPFILFVHDMTHELFPHYFSINDKTILHKKILIEKANEIIVVSENTKRDIMTFYPNLDISKIHVIHLAQSLPSGSAKSIQLPKKYLLYVGARKGYKNFNFCIDAIANLLRESDELHLVCAGGGSFNDIELKKIADLEISKKVIQIEFNQEELSSIYKHAIAFVFPSKYEGFGIPILEAMKSGCPVILSKSASFPEVARDAALYFEPGNSQELVVMVSKILSDDVLRLEMINRGREREKKFSWERIKNQFIEVLNITLSTKLL